jgi:hypothetical protein
MDASLVNKAVLLLYDRLLVEIDLRRVIAVDDSTSRGLTNVSPTSNDNQHNISDSMVVDANKAQSRGYLSWHGLNKTVDSQVGSQIGVIQSRHGL